MMQTDTTASFWPTMWINWMLQDNDRSEDLHLKTSLWEAGLLPDPYQRQVQALHGLQGLPAAGALTRYHDSLPSSCSLAIGGRLAAAELCDELTAVPLFATEASPFS